MTAPTPHDQINARTQQRTPRTRLGRAALVLAGVAVAATVTIAATSGTSTDAEASERAAEPVETVLVSAEFSDAEIERLRGVAREAEEARVVAYVEAVQKAEAERAFVAAVEAARAEQAAAEAAAAAAAAERAAAERAAAEQAAARATSSGGGGMGGGWAALRRCESGGNYGAVSSTGKYRGAYQFSRQTWDATARRSHPHLVGVDPAAASPGDQDAMAQALYRAAGAGQWPHCGRNL